MKPDLSTPEVPFNFPLRIVLRFACLLRISLSKKKRIFTLLCQHVCLASYYDRVCI